MNVHVNRPGKYIKCRLCLVGLKWGLRFCISMPIKVRTVQAVVFPVDMYGRESWIIKEAEGQRCFQTVVLGKTLESLLDSKEIKPVNPKGNQPWILIEGLMLKRKLQYFGHLMWRADSLEKTLILGKIEGRRRSGWQRMRWLDCIIDSMDMSEQTPGNGEGQRSLVWCSL